MNIKNIIGLGLLTYFTNCGAPLLTVAPAPACPRHPAPPQVQPAPVSEDDDKPYPSKQHYHIDSYGKVQQSTNEQTHNEEAHQSVKYEDQNQNTHQKQRWVHEGKPHEVDQWTDHKSGASVHSHKYVGDDDCTHQIRVVTDIKGQVHMKHYKKDQKGEITEVEEQEDQEKPIFHTHQPQNNNQHRHQADSQSEEKSQASVQKPISLPVKPAVQVRIGSTVHAPGCPNANLQSH